MDIVSYTCFLDQLKFRQRFLIDKIKVSDKLILGGTIIAWRTSSYILSLFETVCLTLGIWKCQQNKNYFLYNTAVFYICDTNICKYVKSNFKVFKTNYTCAHVIINKQKN